MNRKNYICKAILLPVLVLALLGMTRIHADAQRDPFDEPATGMQPHQHGLAIQQITLKGIVRMENLRIAIVRIGGIEEPVVLKPGDKFALDHEGMAHEFAVVDIHAKSVRFDAIAGPASHRNAPSGEPEKKSYEVFIR